MKYFIDTNIFLRLLLEDNTQYEDCFLFLNAVSSGQVEGITSSLVYAEIAFTLRSFYSLSKENIVKSLEIIRNVNNIDICNQINNDLSIELFKNYNIKFIDATMASIREIKEGQWVIVSYDKDFDKIKGVRRMEPAEVLQEVNRVSRKLIKRHN
jgi:predicted nucleic acid-binding protein